MFTWRCNTKIKKTSPLKIKINKDKERIRVGSVSDRKGDWCLQNVLI